MKREINIVFYLILVIAVCYGIGLLSEMNTYVALVTSSLGLFILAVWLLKIRKRQEKIPWLSWLIYMVIATTFALRIFESLVNIFLHAPIFGGEDDRNKMSEVWTRPRRRQTADRERKLNA